MKLRRYKLKWTALLLALVLIVGSAPPAHGADLPSAWAEEEVNRAITYNLIPDTLQSQWQQPVTRAEFTRMALQILSVEYGYDGIPAFVNDYITWNPDRDSIIRGAAPDGSSWWEEFSAGPGSFTDLPEQGDWGFVCAAYAMGLVNGTGEEGCFNPTGQITRQEATCLLVRTYHVMDYWGDDHSPTPLYDFEDYQEMDFWARDGISAVLGIGLMAGTSDTRFEPLGLYTREQAALTFLRMYEDTDVGALRGNLVPLEQRAYSLALDQALNHLGTIPSEVDFRAEVESGTVLALTYRGIMSFYHTLLLVGRDGVTRTLWEGGDISSQGMTSDWAVSEDGTTLTFTTSIDGTSHCVSLLIDGTQPIS